MGPPPPYALHVAGLHAEAAARWQELGCPYEAADALADSDDPGLLRQALQALDRLDATAARPTAPARLGCRQTGAAHRSRGRPTPRVYRRVYGRRDPADPPRSPRNGAAGVGGRSRMRVAGSRAAAGLPSGQEMLATHPSVLLQIARVPVLVGLGLIPPILRIGWFGLGRFVWATGAPTGNTSSQVLGVTWLVIVVMTAVRQVRASRAQPGVEVASRERER